ncbi:hypothetical protein [Amycolatopsis minnesotensis]|uniref:Uncharacterized protein n=1 Tax=Amycolatopsis minnesotensis TaxID=337894 RepID=A0ABP5CTQ8_9PSEU
MNQQYPNQHWPHPGGPPRGYPPYQGFPGAQPPGIPPKKSKKKLVFGIVGGVVVLVAASIVAINVFGSHSGRKADTGGGTATAATFERPGYRRGPAEADPFAIVEEPNPAPARYEGKPVIQACNLVSLKDLADHGLRLLSFTDPDTAIKRVHPVDENEPGLGKPPKSDITVLTDDSRNSCDYHFELTGDRPESVMISVHQETYFDVSKVPGRYLSGPDAEYTKQGQVGAVEQYTTIKRPVLADREALLKLGDTYVRVSASMPGNGELSKQFDPLVRLAAENVAKQAANPAGPSRYRFDSPAFRTPAGIACDILRAGDLQTLLGQPTTPFIQTGPPTAIGTISVPDNHTEGNFLHTSCFRRAVNRAGLVLTVDTYDDAKLATGVFDYFRGNHKGIPLPAPIADGAYVDSEGDPDLDLRTPPGRLTVRKGNVILSLSPSLGQLDQSKLVETADRYLRPVVEQMLTRLPK